MNIQRLAVSGSLVFAALCVATGVFAQVPDSGYAVTRTKTISKTVKFGPGGTVVVLGAPKGAVSVEGWTNHQVAVEAEIVVFADSEDDAAQLANVSGFSINEDITSVRIYSIGPHDKKAVKKIDKKFPKRLRKNPVLINYRIKVPHFSDLQIDGGSGALRLEGIEGVLRVNYLESDAVLKLIGGSVQVTVGTGTLDVTIQTRSWRGRDADIQLAKGVMRLWLPKNLNADLSAQILRTGTISNSYKSLVPRRQTEFSETLINAIAGSGGARLAFSVGEGSLEIQDFERSGQ